MRKLIRNSLIVSAVAVASATASVGKVHAETASIDFAGTVGNVCTITKDSNGTLKAVSANVMDANANRGAVRVNCAASGAVTISKPTATTTAATSYANLSGTQTVAELWNSPTGGSYLADSEGLFGSTSYTAASNGVDVPIYVNMFTRNGSSPMPAGAYGFTTTVTVNPL